MLESVTGAQTQMWGKNQLTISVDVVTVEQEVWLENIMELCILDLDVLEQLGATVDTVGKLSSCLLAQEQCV